MGTAILLPQDCLPTAKGRHKANFSDVLYGSDSIPRARGTFQGLDSHSFYPDQSKQKCNPNRRVGWSATPGCSSLPGQGQVFANTNSLQREVDGKKSKARRPVEQRDTKFVSNPVLDVPVFTILQRPKDKEVANEVIAKFLVKVDEAKPTIGLHDSKFDMKVDESKLRSGTQNAFLEVKNGGGSNFKKVMYNPAVEGPKFQESKLDVPKLQGSLLTTKADWPTSKDSKVDRGKHHGVILGSPKPVAKRSGYSRFDDLVSAKGLNQMLALKVTGEYKSLRTAGAAENFSCKLVYANQPARVDNIVEGGLARLRRASTDPQIVKHLVGQYRSEVMEIPYSDTKSFHSISRTSSMSCPERWAGPGYSSSPAPSSLPLPKFSLLNQKTSSPDCSPLLVEGCSTKLTQPPELGSVRVLPGVLQGGELDVASATRSLRRMLKLEPL